MKHEGDDRMNEKTKKTVAAALAAALMTVSAPTAAEAGIFETVVGAGVQYYAISSQLSKEIDYLDNDGRYDQFQELREKYGVNEDPELNARLDSIMAKLTDAVGAVDPSIYDKPYNYFINNDTSFNAFCALGHNMSVNTGMFDLTSCDDEIAVVIGHEMGHGQKNHVKKGTENKLKTTIGLQALAQIVSGGSALGTVVGGFAANYASAVHVQKPQEREADKLSFQYVIHSNYNPGACAAIWQRMLDKHPNSGSSFLSDHPDHKDRRDTYVKSLTEYSDGHVKIDADAAHIKVNGKDFMTAAPGEDMSSQERALFIMGNLASAYHHGQNTQNAWADGGTVMLGQQPIVAVVDGDGSAQELAARLNSIK